MTRCGARGNFVAFQEHQTGAFVVAEHTNGTTRIVKKFWILEDKADPSKDVAILEGEATEENRKESVVCTAISVLGEKALFGMVMILEDRGGYMYRHESASIVQISGGHPESTLAADNAFFCTAQDHNIEIRLCLNPFEEPLVLPVHRLKNKITEDNKIWQVSMRGGTVCAVATTEVHICFANGDPAKRNWATIPMSSVVSSCVFSDYTPNGICKVALLTALGDVIVVSSRRGTDVAVTRIRQKSRIEPFVSSHTRDAIFAWDQTGQKLFLCKSGGGLHIVEPVVATAAIAIQEAWRTYKAGPQKDAKANQILLDREKLQASQTPATGGGALPEEQSGKNALICVGRHAQT